MHATAANAAGEPDARLAGCFMPCIGHPPAPFFPDCRQAGGAGQNGLAAILDVVVGVGGVAVSQVRRCACVGLCVWDAAARVDVCARVCAALCFEQCCAPRGLSSGWAAVCLVCGVPALA